jgi:thioredoxin reductase (NADPH)
LNDKHDLSSKIKTENQLANSDNEVFDVTIIGAGPVGLFASFYAGMRSMKTKLIDTLPELGGQLSTLYPEKPIYDVAGFKQILAKELVARLAEQSSKYDPTICLNERVLSLNKKNDGLFEMKSDLRYHLSKAVVICAGIGAFAPNKLKVPGIEKFEGLSVNYCVKEISTFRNKHVLVIGGGDSAVDWASSLKDIAKSVTLIHRRDIFTAHEDSVKKLKEFNIKIGLNHELKEVRGEKKLQEALIFDNKTRDEKRLTIDNILINIGQKADLGPIREWGLELGRRKVIVNGNMETNIPGVYAAGDIASPSDSIDVNLIVVGFGQAAIAINNAKKYLDPTSSVFPGHISEIKK